MRTKRASLIQAVALTTIALAAGEAGAEVGMTVTGTSDYDFRGVSQTQGDALLQLGVDYTNEAFYASIWASSVDFGPAVDGDLEVDLAAGFTRDINAVLRWDLGAAVYMYPGSHASLGDLLDPADDVEALADYPEAYIGVASDRFEAKYWYSPSLYDTGESASYVDTMVTFPLRADVRLSLHAGHSFGDYFDSLESIDGGDPEYSDFSVGIARSMSHFDIEMKYVWTDVEPQFETDQGPSRNDPRWILSVGTTLPFRPSGGRR